MAGLCLQPVVAHPQGEGRDEKDRASYTNNATILAKFKPPNCRFWDNQYSVARPEGALDRSMRPAKLSLVERARELAALDRYERRALSRRKFETLSFAKLCLILSIEFMYCLTDDFGGTKPSQKNP